MACWEFYAAKNATKADFFCVQIFNIYHYNQLLIIDNSVTITNIIVTIITIIIVIIIIGIIKKQEGLTGCNKWAPRDVGFILEPVPLLPPPLYSAPATIFPSPLSTTLFIPLAHHHHCQYKVTLHNYVVQKGDIFIFEHFCKIFQP